MARTAPQITALEIFQLLAGGKFSPMTAQTREGMAGAGPAALECEHKGFLIIADCQEGEGFHFEVLTSEAASWGVDAATGKVELLCEGFSEEDQFEARADALTDLDRDDH